MYSILGSTTNFFFNFQVKWACHLSFDKPLVQWIIARAEAPGVNKHIQNGQNIETHVKQSKFWNQSFFIFWRIMTYVYHMMSELHHAYLEFELRIAVSERNLSKVISPLLFLICRNNCRFSTCIIQKNVILLVRCYQK